VPYPPAFTPEWALFRFLDDWTPGDLDIAVRKNLEVDFSASLGMVEDYVTTEILKKFETYRPDLYQVLTKENARKWLKKQIHRSITST
jgi:hypothetical protein